jgi:hypothetical protein
LILHLFLIGSLDDKFPYFLKFIRATRLKPTRVMKDETMSGWIYNLILDIMLSTLVDDLLSPTLLKKTSD